MKLLWRLFITLIVISVVAFIATRFFDVQLGHENYWNNHGLFFLLFLATFPRLTLLFSSVATGGALWWLSWLFVPRILVAMLATFAYWQQNPVLVALAWLFAIGGESGEKYYVVRRSTTVVRPRGPVRQPPIKDIKAEVFDVDPR